MSGTTSLAILWALGGQAGMTVSSQSYFPAYLAGGTASMSGSLGDHVAAGCFARLQLYAHPEDEDYGSSGLQLDGGVELRLDALPTTEAHAVYPFATLRA